MRVNYHTVTCTGVGPGTCLLVQTGEKLNSDQWEYFYFDNSIQGFDYEPGYIYTLSVDMEKITNPPADASDTKYTLIKILAKEKVN
ncbi:DUF4377 domain-containing protein [Paradesertivirga mongoliensis]|nr:DUF4377 domain-containing protein [Pedobacter mongoliensis]